jgi:hypothetical protein
MTGMKNALDDLAKTVPAAKDAKPGQFIDLRFLDNLDKSGPAEGALPLIEATVLSKPLCFTSI